MAGPAYTEHQDEVQNEWGLRLAMNYEIWEGGIKLLLAAKYTQKMYFIQSKETRQHSVCKPQIVIQK